MLLGAHAPLPLVSRGRGGFPYGDKLAGGRICAEGIRLGLIDIRIRDPIFIILRINQYNAQVIRALQMALIVGLVLRMLPERDLAV